VSGLLGSVLPAKKGSVIKWALELSLTLDLKSYICGILKQKHCYKLLFLNIGEWKELAGLRIFLTNT